MKEEDAKPEPFIAPELAKGLEQSQIARYHTRGGTGFSAEDANAFADRAHFKQVEVTGTSQEKNGADRIVNGVPIQTKYYASAAETIGSAFDVASGKFRYEGQQLEVPKDQYDDCVRLMRERISRDEVPGVKDPSKAEKIIRKGDVTYKQARNIARAGNIDSLLFDVKTQSVATTYVFAVTFAVHFAKGKWNGDKTEDAIKGALDSATAAGGLTFMAGIISAQLLRSRVAAVGVVAARVGVKAVGATSVGKKAVERLAQASLGKAVYGAAAINRVSKLLRSNVITSAVVTAVISAPDLYRAAWTKRISWRQLVKNTFVNGSGVVGGAGGCLVGSAAGAAVGSVVPVIGTVVVGGIGGLIGALGGNWLGAATAKGIADGLIDDDAKRMQEILHASLEELAGDYLLSEFEVKGLLENVGGILNQEWFRSMYQSGSNTSSNAARQTFAYDAFDPACQTIISKRVRITLPPQEIVEAQIVQIPSIS